MSDYRVLSIRCAQELRNHAEQWNDLWQCSDVTDPTARAEQVAIWLEHFAPHGEFRALVVEYQGQFLAVLPLMPKAIGGFVQVATLPSNCWSTGATLLLDPSCDTASVLQQLISSLKDLPWPLLWCEDISFEEPHWQAFMNAMRRGRMPCDVRERYRVGQIEIGDDWETYFAGRSSKHRQNRRAEARRLERAGRSELRIRSDIKEGDVERLLRSGFGIEDRSWKHASGTSVLKNSSIFDFYRDQSRDLARHGFLNLLFLEHEEEPIAFIYGWQAKGVGYGMKIGCDATHKKLAPGHQITMRSVQRYHREQNIKLFDFVGPIAPWLEGWSTRTRAVGRLVVALPSLWSHALFHLYTQWEGRFKPMAKTVWK